LFFKARRDFTQRARTSEVESARTHAFVLAATLRKPNSARRHPRRVKQLTIQQRSTSVKNEETKMAKKVKKAAKKAGRKAKARRPARKTARKAKRKTVRRKAAKRKVARKAVRKAGKAKRKVVRRRRKARKAVAAAM
jgi:hypothetical protein